MKMFRSTFLGKGLKKTGGYVRARLEALSKYVFAEMQYVPDGWHATRSWNDPSVADAQEKHWPILVRNVSGPGPLGVAHFPWHTTREDRADHNVMMSYGYVLALSARKRDAISVLDWGGGAGHYWLYSKALLPEVELEYHCFDLPSLCSLGRRLLPGIHVGADEAEFLGRRYDLVISSSALHYFEDWRSEVDKLAQATGEYLYVSRLQVVTRAASFVAAHRMHHSGYGEFLSWCINRQEFLNCLERCGLELVREFVYYNRSVIRGAPEQGDCRGYLFRRRQALREGGPPLQETGT
ncbi:MAG TPA: methyltransferase domain-containing protein [Steroidobacteraceae bacterium]